MSLTHDERRRYARHILMPEMGEAGQARLRVTKIMVIGAGGLGASALSYLAASGVGTIGIIDDDVVELSNLNRQIIHETGDIGRLKVASAKDRISELNPDVRVVAYAERLTEANAEILIRDYDIVVDGCDNFATRYIVNRTCRAHHIPWVYCAVRGGEAQLSCFHTGRSKQEDTPCYQCLVPAPPPNRNDCEERGVLGALVGVMGSLMATEAIKIAVGMGQPYYHRLLRFNAMSGQWRESRLIRDPECGECRKSL